MGYIRYGVSRHLLNKDNTPSRSTAAGKFLHVSDYQLPERGYALQSCLFDNKCSVTLDKAVTRLMGVLRNRVTGSLTFTLAGD